MIIRLFKNKKRDYVPYCATMVGYWSPLMEKEFRTGDGELFEAKTYRELLRHLEDALCQYEGNDDSVDILPLDFEEMNEDMLYTTERVLSLALERRLLERVVEDVREELEKLSSRLEDNFRKTRGY